MAFTTETKNNILNALFNGASLSGGTVTIGLFKPDGSEVSGGGYARQTLTFATATSGTISSNNAVFNNLPTGVQITAYKVFGGSVVLDTQNLDSPFTADISTNTLTVKFTKNM